MDITKKYYEENTKEFFDSTVNANLEEIYQEFMQYVPDGAYILDVGSGSGRDSYAFKQKGYRIKAIDGSKRLCDMAQQQLGIETECMDYSEIDYQDVFDGVWACSSLLHLDAKKLPNIIRRLVNATRDGGVIYMSFKYGDFEGERDGRFFLDLNEDSMARLFADIDSISVLKIWKSEDVRRGKNTVFVNGILKVEK